MTHNFHQHNFFEVEQKEMCLSRTSSIMGGPGDLVVVDMYKAGKLAMGGIVDSSMEARLLAEVKFTPFTLS